LGLIAVVFFIIIAAVLTLGWHLLAPDGWHWLSGSSLQDVKDFVLSGALVGFGTAYVRRYFKP